jgi:hypothetical protein
VQPRHVGSVGSNWYLFADDLDRDGEWRKFALTRVEKVKPLADGGVEMTLTAPVNEELMRWIREWGAETEVVGPAGVRRAVVADARAVLAMYGGRLILIIAYLHRHRRCRAAFNIQHRTFNIQHRMVGAARERWGAGHIRIRHHRRCEADCAVLSAERPTFNHWALRAAAHLTSMPPLR